MRLHCFDRVQLRDRLSKIVLPALTAAFTVNLSVFAAEPVSPQSPVNLDARHDVAALSGFFLDTNRALPILFIVGDSTVHNPQTTERGWGDVVGHYFDTNRIRVENHALPGRSSRTFQTQGWWDQVLVVARPGDFVLVQMGHNLQSDHAPTGGRPHLWVVYAQVHFRRAGQGHAANHLHTHSALSQKVGQSR
jgi:hypothetical protein